MIDKGQGVRGSCCLEFFELARMNSKKVMTCITTTTTGDAASDARSDFDLQLS